jgi:hypothetical protein
MTARFPTSVTLNHKDPLVRIVTSQINAAERNIISEGARIRELTDTIDKQVRKGDIVLSGRIEGLAVLTSSLADALARRNVLYSVLARVFASAPTYERFLEEYRP